MVTNVTLQMITRPSHKELSSKLQQASELVAQGLISILEPAVIVTDAIELGYSFQLEFDSIFQELLSNAKPENYAGGRPPQRSYETRIKGAELYAFVVQSEQLDGADVYFKYALYNDVVVLVSLHQDKQGGNNGKLAE